MLAEWKAPDAVPLVEADWAGRSFPRDYFRRNE